MYAFSSSGGGVSPLGVPDKVPLIFFKNMVTLPRTLGYPGGRFFLATNPAQ